MVVERPTHEEEAHQRVVDIGPEERRDLDPVTTQERPSLDHSNEIQLFALLLLHLLGFGLGVDDVKRHVATTLVTARRVIGGEGEVVVLR